MSFHFLNHLLTHLRRSKAKKIVRIAGLEMECGVLFVSEKLNQAVWYTLREAPFGRRNHHALSELKKYFLETYYENV